MIDHKPTPKAGSDHISYSTDTPTVAARCDVCGSVIYIAGRGDGYWRHKAQSKVRRDAVARDRNRAEHAAGEHADFVDMDCPTCVAEQREIGGHA